MSNDKLIGVNKVIKTFVWNFQANAHSGLTTLMLNEKNRTQSNKDTTMSGQSTWMSCATKLKETMGIDHEQSFAFVLLQKTSFEGSWMISRSI